MSSPPPPPQLLHVDKLTTKLGPLKREGGREGGRSISTNISRGRNDTARSSPVTTERQRDRERAGIVSRPPVVVMKGVI